MNQFEKLKFLELDDMPAGLNLTLVEDGVDFYWWQPNEQRYSQGFKSEKLALKALRDGKLWFMLARIH